MSFLCRICRNRNYIMIKHPGRSFAYHGTVDNNAEGLLELATLRQEIKVHNADERLKAMFTPGYKAKCRRVLAFGRLGKNNPNAVKYKKGGDIKSKMWASFSNAYQYIRKADAATLDLYIHPVYNY